MDVTTYSDEELFGKFQQNQDPHLFSELARRYTLHILKKCQQHLKNMEDAQDVSQEVLLRLLTKAHTYQAHLPFRPWLNQVIHNRCMDHLQQDKQRLHQEISTKIVDTVEEVEDTETVMRPTTEILEELLEKMSGEDKLLLVLKYQQRWSVQAIQQLLNLNENTIKSRLKRNREKLQQLLAQYSESSSRD
jgi:RNA polymerase sigma-70 factor (ECF subfamily)